MIWPFTRPDPVAEAQARLAADVEVRKRLIGRPYEKRRAAALKGHKG